MSTKTAENLSLRWAQGRCSTQKRFRVLASWQKIRKILFILHRTFKSSNRPPRRNILSTVPQPTAWRKTSHGKKSKNLSHENGYNLKNETDLKIELINGSLIELQKELKRNNPAWPKPRWSST